MASATCCQAKSHQQPSGPQRYDLSRRLSSLFYFQKRAQRSHCTAHAAAAATCMQSLLRRLACSLIRCEVVPNRTTRHLLTTTLMIIAIIELFHQFVSRKSFDLRFPDIQASQCPHISTFPAQLTTTESFMPPAHRRQVEEGSAQPTQHWVHRPARANQAVPLPPRCKQPTMS